MTETRTARDMDTRDMSARPASWKPASTLPEPDKLPGYAYRWVRVTTMAQQDPRNVSSKFREGWEPVRIEEQPQFHMVRDTDSRFPDNIEIGGLLLCKMPDTFVAQREAYFARQNHEQMQSVDNNFMRENDPRMPLFRERKSSISFGKGK